MLQFCYINIYINFKNSKYTEKNTLKEDLDLQNKCRLLKNAITSYLTLSFAFKGKQVLLLFYQQMV